MAHISVQVAFERTTALPKDRIVNTLHFDCPAAGTAVITPLTTLISKMWTQVNSPGVDRLDVYAPPMLSGIVNLKFYDMAQPKPRPPIGTSGFTIAIGTTGNYPLPAEVALVGSYHATPAAGERPARRRGRIFFGPLNTGCVSTTVTAGDARPFLNAQKTIAGAMRNLVVNAPTGYTWCVYSPTDHVLAPVTGVHCDDAFDTQRRRGAQSNSRFAISVP
jgi:hypothetical protein